MSKLTAMIIDVTGKKECDASCGEDWSSPDVIALVSQRIKERFGDEIQLEYLNLTEATTDRQTSKWRQAIKNLSVPVLLINSEPRIAGQFSIRQLLAAIEAEIEIGALS